ncbi:MAG: hypothetical protein IPL22_00500 [Bacteroidetes bacterium]|nr:hypothetical protein [Bacteroidota bacterium]
MKTLTLMLLFIASASKLIAQPESSLNELLSICRKAKTESEDNARFIKQFWKAEEPRYADAIKMYNSARAEFDEWIEFYKLETTMAIENKSYTIKEDLLKTKIDDALSAVNKFNSYYYNDGGNNASAARNSGPIVPIINVSSCFDAALGTIKFIHGAKKEKQEQMKKELHEKLERYQLVVFNEIK